MGAGPPAARPVGMPKRPRTENAAAATADVAQSFFGEQQDILPPRMHPLVGGQPAHVQQQPQAQQQGGQGASAEAIQQLQAWAQPPEAQPGMSAQASQLLAQLAAAAQQGGTSLDAAFRGDRGALERAVQAQLKARSAQRQGGDSAAAAAAQQLADDALAVALAGVSQHRQPPLVAAAGEAEDVVMAEAGPLLQEQQTAAAVAMQGAEEAASPEQPAAERATGTPEEAAKKLVDEVAAEKAGELAETPDRATEQATAVVKGSAAADMQLDTPLKMDEDIPAAAARDRPDSATIAP